MCILQGYLGRYTYHISAAGWGFPVLAAAAFMKVLRVKAHWVDSSPGLDLVSCLDQSRDRYR